MTRRWTTVCDPGVTESRTLALMHPGAMGATVGASLRAAGHRVRWLADGRGEASRQRARAAGLETCEGLDALLDGAAAVISVCPPEAALALAQRVANSGFPGWFVDANAVAPATVRAMGTLFGERLVDGGIVGPPARRPGTTRLYLSGGHAPAVAGWFDGGALEAIALDAPAGAASALKMCYASYTKGTSALLLAIRALARAEGVEDALLSEWGRSQPELEQRSNVAATGTAPKAWRFVGEMEEIAATFESAGLPGGFHRAAAQVYGRMAGLKDETDVDLATVVDRLLNDSPPPD